MLQLSLPWWERPVVQILLSVFDGGFQVTRLPRYYRQSGYFHIIEEFVILMNFISL